MQKNLTKKKKRIITFESDVSPLPNTDESSTHLPLLQRKENLKKKD